MDKNEYSRFWKDRLMKYEHALDTPGIPESARAILEEWGLPRLRGSNLKFTAMQKPLRQAAFDGIKYYVFGYDYEVPLGIGPRGRIWSLESEIGEAGARFVNTSLATFVEFLCVVPRRRRKAWKIDADDEEGLLKLAKETEEKMREIDSKAMVNEEYYWSVVVEQMGYGMI
jgi:hypothetical protein